MINIRDASKYDLPAIVGIYNSTIAGRMVTADTKEITVESRIKWFNDHSPEFRPIWVAEEAGQVIGWLSFQSFYGRSAYNATVEISIYVHENHRKKGLGEILLTKALHVAPLLNIKTILGFIFGHNEPSVRLFTKYNFTVWGEFPGIAELDGVERDLLIFGRRIS